MKIPLIDEFKHDSSCHVVVTPQGEFQGFMFAKPMNYDPEYLSKKERKAMADAIMEGKAIAVRFFNDFSEEEKREYVTKGIDDFYNKDENDKNRERSLSND